MDNEIENNEALEDNSVKEVEKELMSESNISLPPEYEKELLNKIDAKMTEFMKKYLKEGSVINKPVEPVNKKKLVKDLRF